VTVETSTWATKKGLAQMLKGGVIMDVVTAEHAKIAEDAGAVAVMALERVPADIRASGGVARMSDPALIVEIMDAVTIPVMAKARIGHFVEAQVLEALGVDYIDESEVLTPADEVHHIDKHQFKVPFVCGCRDLGEALRRISEGAAMIRTKGEAGTGNIVEAVRHIRALQSGVRDLQAKREDELFVAAKELRAPVDLVQQVAREGRLPVVNFVAGGIATPADAALAMQLGAEGVFVGSGIFKSEDPARTANAIVQATTHFDNPQIIAEVSRGLGSPMRGPSWAPSRRQSDWRFGAGSRVGASVVVTAAATPPAGKGRVRIGVLAVQGAFQEHLDVLRGLGVDAVAVRLPRDLEGVSGLILPGGESTTMRKLIDRWGLREPINALLDQGAPVLGTCAGMILLARHISDGDAPVFPRLDIGVKRNAFGRQLDSFEADLEVPVLGDRGVHAVFIRAPVVERTGPDVDVLAELDDGRVVAVRSGSVLATAFHPELSGETRFHRLIATMASEWAEPAEGSGRRRHPLRRSRAGGR
jgi:pyridoxal 5'-phosphate synthase pdxS subunit